MGLCCLVVALLQQQKRRCPMTPRVVSTVVLLLVPLAAIGFLGLTALHVGESPAMEPRAEKLSKGYRLPTGKNRSETRRGVLPFELGLHSTRSYGYRKDIASTICPAAGLCQIGWNVCNFLWPYTDPPSPSASELVLSGGPLAALVHGGGAPVSGLCDPLGIPPCPVSWKPCPVTVCLAGLFLISVWQLVPWPDGLLGWVSPAAVRLHQQFVPAQPEMLLDGQPKALAAFPATRTISLCPGGTREDAVQSLAALLVFVLVRQSLASIGSLHRLSVVLLANGALLAFFALVQFFTSPRGMVYWTYATGAGIFGPLNRSHYAYYLNLCTGLGIGLLLRARYSTRDGLNKPEVPARRHPLAGASGLCQCGSARF